MTDLILLEDEPVMAAELREFLEECGYRVSLAGDLASFRETFDASRHRLAVVDLGLPDGDGLELIRALREAGERLGIVAFSARGAPGQRVSGFGAGADHYLPKGCDLDELAAVLGAAPRSLKAPNQRTLRLSQQDTLVLQCLMRGAGGNVTRKEIVRALDEDYLTYDQRRLDTQIRRLRRNVEQGVGLTLPIKTLRASGYCFYERARIIE